MKNVLLLICFITVLCIANFAQAKDFTCSEYIRTNDGLLMYTEDHKIYEQSVHMFGESWINENSGYPYLMAINYYLNEHDEAKATIEIHLKESDAKIYSKEFDLDDVHYQVRLDNSFTFSAICF